MEEILAQQFFQHAELKIFMTADIAVRVERRFKELYEVRY